MTQILTQADASTTVKDMPTVILVFAVAMLFGIAIALVSQ